VWYLPRDDGVLVANTLYLSGYGGIDPKTGAVPASPKEEMRLAMDAVRETLRRIAIT
jgi:enamine deaminase RidA (YjgF/YER057c/UK114 family)